MKNTCALILSFLSPALLWAQKPTADCREFKNGVFTTVSEVSGLITISRHGNTQTETTSKGIKMVFTVTWLNDCSYTLKPSPETVSKYKIPTNALLTVYITKPNANGYFQVTTSNLSARKAGSQVVKIGA